MRIHVTQEDLSKARPGPYTCPIARAILRATGREVGVFATYTRFSDRPDRIPLPAEAMEFVLLWDSQATRRGALPFEFDLPGLEVAP